MRFPTAVFGLATTALGLTLLPLHDARAQRFDLSFDAASNPPESDIHAGSSGREPIHRLLVPGFNDLIFFSVDRVAVGASGSPIEPQGSLGLGSAHGDIYTRGPAGVALFAEEASLGLNPGFFGDDIDALQALAGSGVDPNASFPYITIWRNSPLISLALQPSDIVLGPGGPLFASGILHMGLQFEDGIDALMLLDVTPLAGGGVLFEPNGVLDPGFDLAIFSLDAFSPSTNTGGFGPFTPGDALLTRFDGASPEVLFSFSEFGLEDTDNLDAFSIISRRVPESGAGLLAIGLAALVFLRRILKN